MIGNSTYCDAIPVLATPYLTTPQAAAYLGISPRTLEDWRLRGGGPNFRKIGRLVRYARSDLDGFMDTNRFRNSGETRQAA